MCTYTDKRDFNAWHSSFLALILSILLSVVFMKKERVVCMDGLFIFICPKICATILSKKSLDYVLTNVNVLTICKMFVNEAVAHFEMRFQQ